MEIKEFLTKLQPYEVNAVCPKCDENFGGGNTIGFLIAFGGTYTTTPSQRDHKCNHCGHVERIRGGVEYPYVRYEAVR